MLSLADTQLARRLVETQAVIVKDIYNPDGVMRPARVNRSLSAMDRLYKRRDKNGQTLLSDAEYEAGQRYARDYALAGYDVLATQNYMRAGADKSAYFGHKEDEIHGRMDAQMGRCQRVDHPQIRVKRFGRLLWYSCRSHKIRSQTLESIKKTEAGLT